MFSKDGRNVYIPIENTREIYCLNEVSINTKFAGLFITESCDGTFFQLLWWIQWYFLSERSVFKWKTDSKTRQKNIT